MKSFACGDVVPGCDAQWVCSSEDEILSLVAGHAATAHGLVSVPQDLMQSVLISIVDVA